MDVSRFHYALDAFVKDIKNTAANENLQGLIGALSNVASSPGQPQYFEQYKAQLEALRQALQASDLNNPDFELKRFLDELELNSLVGDGLFESILESISNSNLSPNHALTGLQQLQAKFLQKLASAQAANEAFTVLGVPYEAPGESDAEIEIRIPVEYQSKTLEHLAREAKEWHRDLSTISEVFDPERSEANIRTLSTGSWEIYLASAPLVLFGVSKCIKGINTILVELITSRKLLSQLMSAGAPKKVISEFEKHVEQSVGANLDKLASSLVDEYYKGEDAGRRAELKNALTQSLKRLSKKLSEGSTVGLRLTKPRAPKVVDLENPTQQEVAEIALAKEFEQIRLQTLKTIEQTPELGHDSNLDVALPAPDVIE